MIYKPQSTDKSPEPHSEPFETMLPLCFQTIYYMESTENEALNNLVQQYFQQDPNSLLPHDLRRLPYRFRYITQEEVQSDNLRESLAKNGIDVDSPAATETVALLRECLHSETGGFLAARLLTKPITDDEDEEDADSQHEHLLTLPLLKANNPQRSILDFVSQLAQADFKTLAGTSFYSYYHDKYDNKTSGGLPTGMMGFLVVRTDTEQVDETIRNTLSELCDRGLIKLSDGDIHKNPSSLFKEILEAIDNNKKLTQPCGLWVNENGQIFLDTPDGPLKCNCRGKLSRALYILFLRQIERAENDPSGQTPTSICLVDLDKYYDELVNIYKQMNPQGNIFSWKRSIKILCEEPSNEISHINTDFKGKFHVDHIRKKYNKHYTIDLLNEKDPQSGQSLYAIGLSMKDITLGEFSINKL
jgi:hypothetical protein